MATRFGSGYEKAYERDSITAPEDISLQMELDSSCWPCETEYVETPYGQLLVTVQGDRGKPAIVTYHDVGLNHQTAFGAFMGEQSMNSLTTQFCWYHVDAPGQELHTQKFPPDFIYPSMTQMAEQIEYLVDHFQLGYFVGVGVGAGANILARYAIINSERVSGLVLINFVPNSISWINIHKLAGKAVSWQLKDRDEGVPWLSSYLLSRQAFGPMSAEIDKDLKRVYSDSVEGQNPHNLALFLDSYYRRSCITSDVARNIKCHCLFVVSSNFEHKEQVVKFCSLMNTKRTTFLEINNCSNLLLDEQPAKVATALKLFIQGLGLGPSLLSSSTLHTPSHPHTITVCGRPAVIHASQV